MALPSTRSIALLLARFGSNAHTIADEDFVCRMGEPADSLYFIKSGQVSCHHFQTWQLPSVAGLPPPRRF